MYYVNKIFIRLVSKLFEPPTYTIPSVNPKTDIWSGAKRLIHQYAYNKKLFFSKLMECLNKLIYDL